MGISRGCPLLPVRSPAKLLGDPEAVRRSKISNFSLVAFGGADADPSRFFLSARPLLGEAGSASSRSAAETLNWGERGVGRGFRGTRGRQSGSRVGPGRQQTRVSAGVRVDGHSAASRLGERDERGRWRKGEGGSCRRRSIKKVPVVSTKGNGPLFSFLLLELPKKGKGLLHSLLNMGARWEE